MGYGRPRRLRSLAAALLSGHGRHSDVLLDRLARLAGEHPGEVDARGEALLPERTHHFGRQQKRLTKRPVDHPRAEQDEAGAGEAGRGSCHGRENQRVRLSRVLGQK